MHRFILVALAALLVSSCDRFPDNGLQIAGMVPLSDMCTADPTNDARLAFGLWDVQQPFGDILRIPDYYISPVLESYIVSRATDVQAEQNNLQVTGFEVTLQRPGGETLVFPEGFPNPYTVTASANLPAAVDDAFSAATAITVAVPASYRPLVVDAVFPGQLIIAFRAIGETMGGFTQKSATFFWPVTLCMGCLNLCPTQQAADDLTELEQAALLAACFPGQDGYPYCPFEPMDPPPEDPAP